MKRVLNVLLIGSLLMILIIGGALYTTYKKSLTRDTSLLELNSSKYQKPLVLKEGRVDDIALNIIFYTSSDQTKLQDIVLEVLHCKNKQLSYITIPINTDIMLEPDLYQKLAIIDPNMPQYFRLSELATLLDEKERYDYAQLILDRVLQIDSSYYMVFHGEESTFAEYQSHFAQQKQEGTMISQIMKEGYRNCKSNLKKKDWLKYTSYYEEVQADNIRNIAVEGTKHTDSFEIDHLAFSRMLAELVR